MNEQQVEDKIVALGLTAPRLTPDDIDALIEDEAYHVFPGTTVTVCCLTLANGYHVVGQSACAARENFSPEVGRMIARENAREDIWPLAGYALREQLFKSGC